MTVSPVDVSSFKRILARNVALPLAVGVASAAVFLAIVFYLLNVMSAVEHSERVIGQANQVVKLVVDQETGLRGFLITGDETFLQPYNVARPRYAPEFEALQELVADNSAQLARLRQARAMQGEWDRFAATVIEARRRGGDFLTPVKEGRGKNNTDEVRRQFEQFIADEHALREERSTTARRVVVSTVSFYLVFSLGVAGLLAYFGRRELMRLSNTYGDALAQQSTHNEFLQQQTWLRTGESELATQTAGQESLAALSRSALEFVARYLDAAVGAFYVREDDGSLRRVASYAFGDRAGAHGDVLQPRESLVGQAVDEGRVIRLEDVSPDYIKVSSGLGAAAPRHLLIAPFNNEGKINGALEIGFMRPLTQREIEFLNAVGDNLGASVAAARYRQRLQEVLSETQQLNEELQVQQEELRTANEELEEQSRVLEEAQTNLENQQAELEQTNEQLSAQAQVLDQRNTALNDARVQLEDRARELERASRYKSEFLANMSHELRTPLNSSLILAKLLSENAPGNLNEEQVRFAQTIYSAGNDLLSLINDILDISKVEAGKLELDPEQLPLRRAVESLAMIFEPLAMQKQLEFRVEFEPQVPASLYTDRQRLEQILKNLLSNAIKFTDRGSIVLRVRAAPPGHVSFAVTDSGIGIRRDQQEIIFEAFRQADGSTARKYGGTGLGLSISRDLAHLLGGAITVESEEGRGSTFILTLPLDWSGAPAVEPPQGRAPADGAGGHAARGLA
ncbi:GAF domain-containing protein, partial [Massilia arenosa]